MRAVKNVLKYPYINYTPYGLNTANIMSAEEIAAEYTRLRAIANKRLRRLSEAGFETAAAFYHPQGFPKLSELTTLRARANALSDVANFIRSRGSTVTGQREMMNERLKTLITHFPEIDWTQIDMRDFFDFMTHYHKSGHDNIIPSDETVEIYAIAKRKHMTTASLKRELAEWTGNRDLLERYKPEGSRQRTSEYIRKRLHDE